MLNDMDLNDLRDMDYEAGYKAGWKDCELEFAYLRDYPKKLAGYESLAAANYRVMREEIRKELLDANRDTEERISV